MIAKQNTNCANYYHIAAAPAGPSWCLHTRIRGPAIIGIAERRTSSTAHDVPVSYRTLRLHRTCYNANPRPDALMKEQLVEMTGLSPRVIRVWFQNKRCKDKKKTIQMKLQMQQEKVSYRVRPVHCDSGSMGICPQRCTVHSVHRRDASWVMACRAYRWWLAHL